MQNVCAALAYLLIDKVEEGQLVMTKFPQNEKLTLFFDHIVERWVENQNVPSGCGM